MKLLHILALILPTASFCQTWIHVDPWHCTDNSINYSLSPQPNKVLIQFRATWTDGLPKRISATLNGDDDGTTWIVMNAPDTATILANYSPLPGETGNNPGFVLGLWNYPQGNIELANTSGQQCSALVEPAPEVFEMEELALAIDGDTTRITSIVNASDWNIGNSSNGDCGMQETELSFDLVDCATNSVMETQARDQSSSTPDTYAVEFTYAGPAKMVRVVVRMIHTESGIVGPFGPSITSQVGQRQSDEILVGDFSTLIKEHSAETLLVFPNPARESITLAGIARPAMIVLTDVNGRTVSSESHMPNEPMDISHLAPGTCIATVDGRAVRFIKER